MNSSVCCFVLVVMFVLVNVFLRLVMFENIVLIDMKCMFMVLVSSWVIVVLLVLGGLYRMIEDSCLVVIICLIVFLGLVRWCWLIILLSVSGCSWLVKGVLVWGVLCGGGGMLLVKRLVMCFI